MEAILSTAGPFASVIAGREQAGDRIAVMIERLAFIARTLALSFSTVRTHVRNIYRKINVSSQEELLALIDAQG